MFLSRIVKPGTLISVYILFAYSVFTNTFNAVLAQLRAQILPSRTNPSKFFHLLIRTGYAICKFNYVAF